jgi:hypothetical protein
MAWQGYTLPAASGGLNLIDAIDAMPENDALELVNVYPKGTNVCVRKGFSLHANAGATAQARTLMQLPLQSGTTKFIKAANGNFYDVSTSTESSVKGATTPSSNDWNYTVFNNRLFCANGADTAQVYTGTGNFADCTFTGVTLSTLVSVSSYRSRIYFVELNSASFWYGGSGSVSGALTEYDLSDIFSQGGRLLFAGSWTNQTTTTSADLFFAVSSEGEVLFYAGSYPGDVNSWSLVARYIIGKPLGYRSFIRVDNDVWIITQQGIMPISALFSGGSTVALDTVGRKINPLISQYAATIPTSHLWHGMHWPGGRRVFLAVPRSGSDILVLVCNTDTKAWTKYDLGAADTPISLGMFGGSPYFGSASGDVFALESGTTDNGAAISFDILGAFNFFGSRGNFKKFLDVRPIIRAIRGTGFDLGVQTDFNLTPSTSMIGTASGTSTPWGSPWGSPWSSSTEYLVPRYTVRGQGHSGALRVRGSVSDSPLEFNAFDVRFELGGQV